MNEIQKKKYLVKANLTNFIGDIQWRPGDEIELDEITAKTLLKVGSISNIPNKKKKVKSDTNITPEAIGDTPVTSEKDSNN